MTKSSQTERHLSNQPQIVNTQCRICQISNYQPKLKIPCSCTRNYTHIHQQCLHEWIQRVIIINPRRVKQLKDQHKHANNPDHQYEFTIDCQHWIVYNIKCISPYNPSFNYIVCELVCYLVTLIICLAAVGVIIYVLIKFFREGEDSLFSVIIAFIFLVILVAIVLRMVIQMILRLRVKHIRKLRLIYPESSKNNHNCKQQIEQKPNIDGQIIIDKQQRIITHQTQNKQIILTKIAKQGMLQQNDLNTYHMTIDKKQQESDQVSSVRKSALSSEIQQKVEYINEEQFDCIKHKP